MLGVWSRHTETTQSFCSGFRPTHNSHCGLLGNETADTLAKEGTNREQEDVNNLQKSQVHHQQGSTASGENLIHTAAYPTPSYHAYSFTVNVRTVSTHANLCSSYNHARVHSITSFKATTRALTVQATTSSTGLELDSQNSVLVCCQTGSITTTEQLLQT